VLWHGFDVNPDMNFHFDADPNPDLDRNLNNVDPPDLHADPAPRFKIFSKIGKFFLTLFVATPVYNVFLFSSKSNVS
jgi:hypothetical protein